MSQETTSKNGTNTLVIVNLIIGIVNLILLIIHIANPMLALRIL